MKGVGRKPKSIRVPRSSGPRNMGFRPFPRSVRPQFAPPLHRSPSTNYKKAQIQQAEDPNDFTSIGFGQTGMEEESV